MKENIKNYLEQNKDKFPKEALINALKKSGYIENDINEVANQVYKKSNQDIKAENKPANFWDFKTKKIYLNKKEKQKDFFFGLALPWVFAVLQFIFYNLSDFYIFSIVGQILGIFNLFLLIYFLIKRRYIFYGMISNLLIIIVFAVIIFLLFFVFN